MQRTKIVALLIVGAVIIAAMGILLINNDKNSNSMDISASLKIYGNIDEDYKIDNEDYNLLKKAIENDTTDEFPLADANQDGKVDQNDLDMLDKMVNKRPVTVYVLDDADAIIKLEYPLTKILPVTPDMLSLMITLDAKDKIVAYIASIYEVEQSYILSDKSIRNLGEERQVNDVTYAGVREVSIEKGIGAILFAAPNAVDKKRADLDAAGIPLLCIRCSEPYEFANACLTLGWLMGGEKEQTGMDIWRFSYEVYNNIEEKTRDLEKAKCISITMYRNLSQKDSQYAYITNVAGGNNITEEEGIGSTSLSTPEAITKYDHAEKIISFRTMDLSVQNIVDSWMNTGHDYLKNSAIYEDIVYVNLSMPMCARVAYVAEILYPDLFEGYGDRVFKEFVDEFLPYLNEHASDGDFDVKKDTTTIITYQMYLDAKK